MKIFNVGQKVHYCPKFGEKENGIIKSFNSDKSIAFVVYKFEGDYRQYTGQSTRIEDLRNGWIF